MRVVVISASFSGVVVVVVFSGVVVVTSGCHCKSRKGGDSVGTERAASHKGAKEFLREATEGRSTAGDVVDGALEVVDGALEVVEAEVTVDEAAEGVVPFIVTVAVTSLAFPPSPPPSDFSTAPAVAATAAASFFNTGQSPSIQGSHTTSRPVPSSAHPGA